MIFQMIKRIFDVVCCITGLIVFGPVMLMISLAIYFEDGESIFFTQVRRGLHSHSFRCLKFRTMRENQVTKVGNWLRETGLDELPQILNILKGDMSVVGPRPLSEADISRLGWQHLTYRWSVKPGMTGLAQLSSGNGEYHSRVMDRLYTARRSILLDIRIVLMSLCINIVGKRKFKKIVPLRPRKS